MNRGDIRELHYITPLTNLSSILERGLLSHNRAERLAHVSVADANIQELRVNKKLPNGRYLHDHVNMFFDVRNAMMYKVCATQGHHMLAVIRVSPTAIDLPGAMITDGNAAAVMTRFDAPTSKAFDRLDSLRIYAEYWTDPQSDIQAERKRQRSAEVLIPNTVSTDFIMGIYVSCDAVYDEVVSSGQSISVTISEHLFFQGARRDGELR